MFLLTARHKKTLQKKKKKEFYFVSIEYCHFRPNFDYVTVYVPTFPRQLNTSLQNKLSNASTETTK